MNEQPTPTPGELEILKVLWDVGPASVRTVCQHLTKDKDVVYNTVQTMLRLMEKKGLVSHHVEGRTFIYTPAFSRDDSAAGYLERVFDGAADQLVQSLLRSEAISPDELDRLQSMIDDARLRQLRPE